MNIKDNAIIISQFRPLIPPDLKYDDIVVVYSDGEKWKIVPYRVLQKCLVIYDNMYSHINSQNKTKCCCTLTYCPYTQSIVLYNKRLLLSETQDKKNLLLLDPNTNKIISQLGDNMLIKDDVYRGTVKNMISEFRDGVYLYSDTTLNKKLDTNIDSDEFIHGIEYTSKTIKKDGTQKKKYIMIIHHDKPISDVLEYIDSLYPTITEKGGIIIPSTRSTWKTYFPKTKVVVL